MVWKVFDDTEIFKIRKTPRRIFGLEVWKQQAVKFDVRRDQILQLQGEMSRLPL